MSTQMQTEEAGLNKAGQMGAGKPAKPAAAQTPTTKALISASQPNKPRATIAGIVAAWAADLTPANAPDTDQMGPLAWVRNQKVQELVAALAKGGFN